MPEGYSKLELDCVSGEKLTFQKSSAPDAVVSVTLEGRTVQVTPRALLLALLFFCEEEE